MYGMNWKEEYKQFTSNKKELDLLENGAKSLAQSWHLQPCIISGNVSKEFPMNTPNWQHHSKKEQKRTLKPQAMRARREALRQLKKASHEPAYKAGFVVL